MPKPENIIGKGFDKHPENINRKGQPISIKRQLKELLAKDGELPIAKEQFLRMAEKNGKEYYVFKIPTQMAMAIRLTSMAMGKNNNAFQALKLVQEMFDGKSNQPIEHGGEVGLGFYEHFMVSQNGGSDDYK